MKVAVIHNDAVLFVCSSVTWHTYTKTQYSQKRSNLELSYRPARGFQWTHSWMPRMTLSDSKPLFMTQCDREQTLSHDSQVNLAPCPTVKARSLPQSKPCRMPHSKPLRHSQEIYARRVAYLLVSSMNMPLLLILVLSVVMRLACGRTYVLQAASIVAWHVQPHSWIVSCSLLPAALHVVWH